MDVPWIWNRSELEIEVFRKRNCAHSFSAMVQDQIAKISNKYLGANAELIGVVVGTIDRSNSNIFVQGSLDSDDQRELNGDTAFEIGSITKVFTSLLLTEMVGRKEVSLTDPVSKYLPGSVRVPERNGRQITLADLATQSSGLPSMPENFQPKDEANPYADFSIERLYAFLNTYKLTRDIGSQYEYSNLGYGLLGHALSLAAGRSYEMLLRSRIFDPLGMKSTCITPNAELRSRLAVGHNASFDRVPNWDMNSLASTGALISTANDMLTFLAAQLGYFSTQLADAISRQLSTRRQAQTDEMKIAYGWHIQTHDSRSIVWHNGGTGGYRAYAGFDPAAGIGVIVLCNIAVPMMPDDIGRQLLFSTSA